MYFDFNFGNVPVGQALGKVVPRKSERLKVQAAGSFRFTILGRPASNRAAETRAVAHDFIKPS